MICVPTQLNSLLIELLFRVSETTLSKPLLLRCFMVPLLTLNRISLSGVLNQQNLEQTIVFVLLSSSLAYSEHFFTSHPVKSESRYIIPITII